MRVPRPRRYNPGARVYDVVSLERLLYRRGREVAITRLGLQPGDRVLDVGCGTGLNFPRLRAAVGDGGAVVGLDASAAMLGEARRRVHETGWSNVSTVLGDAGRLSSLTDGHFDAVVFGYSLSVIGAWESAWAQALALVRPGGGIAVADTAFPVGGWRLLAPAAALAFVTGNVHPSRRVWDLVLGATDAPTYAVLQGGHVHVAVGRRRAQDG